MANAESEKILLGSWLLGHNREHVKEFSGEDFSYHRQTFRAIERSWKEKNRPHGSFGESGRFHYGNHGNDQPVPTQLLRWRIQAGEIL